MQLLINIVSRANQYREIEGGRNKEILLLERKRKTWKLTGKLLGLSRVIGW